MTRLPLKPLQPQDWQAAWAELTSDAVHGAGYITSQAVDLLNRVPDDVENASEYFRERVRELIASHPSMALLRNMARIFLGTPDPQSAIADWWSEQLFQQEQSAEAAAALTLPAKRVLTLSHSSAVQAVLRRLVDAKWPGQVLIGESRPLCEGRMTAQLAGVMGLDVTLLADAALIGEVSRDDVVLLGSDWVDSQQWLNKIGSRGLAQSAHLHGARTYVVITTGRIGFGTTVPDQGHDPVELWPVPAERIKVANRYFEWIETSHISRLFLGEIAGTTGQLRDYLQRPLMDSDVSGLLPRDEGGPS